MTPNEHVKCITAARQRLDGANSFAADTLTDLRVAVASAVEAGVSHTEAARAARFGNPYSVELAILAAKGKQKTSYMKTRKEARNA